MKIALLTHSANPRGGVVHTLELGEALRRAGHAVTIFAPIEAGRSLFRPTRCHLVGVPVSGRGTDIVSRIEARIEDYAAFFHDGRLNDFDVVHAQDGVSGNALADLKETGLVGVYARTVHHIDDYGHARLNALEARSIRNADRLFVVSAHWRDRLYDTFGRRAEVVGNGVDPARLSGGDAQALRNRWGLGQGPVFLATGGVEKRKNTHAVLHAFVEIYHKMPDARLIIAGGASILDHGDYVRTFDYLMAVYDLDEEIVVRTGVVSDVEMAGLYALADTLVFASVTEGFGLVVLEAMSAGVPVVASDIAPVRAFADDGVLYCDPLRPRDIARALRQSLDVETRNALISGGRAIAARHDWGAVAAAHLPVYAELEPHHA